MAVAQLRGVKFEQKRGGYWELIDGHNGSAKDALFDVVEFFGFGGDLTKYLSTMRRIGVNIRERATEGGQS